MLACILGLCLTGCLYLCLFCVCLSHADIVSNQLNGSSSFLAQSSLLSCIVLRGNSSISRNNSTPLLDFFTNSERGKVYCDTSTITVCHKQATFVDNTCHRWPWSNAATGDDNCRLLITLSIHLCIYRAVELNVTSIHQQNFGICKFQ